MSNERILKKTKPTLEQLVKRYPNGCPDHVISKFLGITEKAVNERYEAIVACLRQQMKV